MTGEGTVISTSGASATVLIRKTSACSHDCSECSACTAPTFETVVANPAGARAGDRVVIQARTSRILAISLLVYILPVFLLIAAAIACEAFALPVLGAIIIFAFVITLWVLAIRLTAKHMRTSNTIVDIIKD